MRSAQMRARLVEAGLEQHADALVAAAAASIRLRTSAVQPPEVAYRSTPVELAGLTGRAVAIAASDFHGLALLADGSVAAWGNNEDGQLGDGTKAHRRNAVAVRGLSGVRAIAVGQSHSLALTHDGSVYGWGLNRGGQLGDGTRTARGRPVAVEGLDGCAQAIFAGDEASYAVLGDGSVVGWGLNAGELGGFADSPDRPVPVPGLDPGIAAVAAGWHHRAALTATGALIAWGRQPGAPGGLTPEEWAPRPLFVEAPVHAVALGRDHGLALTREGRVLVWGDNALRRLGDGTRESRRTPVPVAGLAPDVVAVAAGWGRSFALKADGTVVGWGWNHEGRLGDGTLIDRDAPVPIAGPHGMRAIAPGAALTEDGRVLVWGGKLPAREVDAEAGLALGASKLGGRPDLPPATAWPQVGGRPLCFVAQLQLADLAPLHGDGLLPGAGLLSFFCCPSDLGRDGAGLVLYNEPGAALVRARAPAELAPEDRIAPARIEPAAELTGLPWESAQLDRIGLSSQQRVAYGEALGQMDDEPVHRMLGHPQAVQHDPRDGHRATCLLLQVDSDDDLGMMWGDVGRLYYLIADEDLRARRFDRCLLRFDAH